MGDRWFVVGEEGRRYSIVVRNRSEFHMEVVLSVDGLDVIDGRPASFRKRGYLIRPNGRLAVEGSGGARMRSRRFDLDQCRNPT